MWKLMVKLGAMGLLVVLAVSLVQLGTAQRPPDKDQGPKEPASVPGPAARAVTSRVTSVTVYASGALVTREVDVPAGAGLAELVVTPLPPTTVQSSLYAEGVPGIRVLSTRFRTRPVLEDTREEVRRLQDELKQLQRNHDKAEADMKANQAAQQYVSKLQNFTSGSTAHAAEKGRLDSDATIALSKYILETQTEKFRELTALQHQVQTIQEQTEFARRKLAELTGSPSRTEQDAVIVVDRAGDAGGKVRLNYLVDAASWRPQYKFRASKDSRDPVRLEYLAAVAQHTGEDWSNVQLVLSTAEPMLNAAPPDLLVLNVSVVPRGGAPAPVAQRPAGELESQVKDLRSKAQKDLNEKRRSSGEGLINTAAALDQSWELLNPEAAVKRGCALAFREGPSVSYHLGTPLTVPSRNDDQIIEVTRFEVAPEYYYKAVPVLTPLVYRLADLTNKSKYVLLPGEATMYLDNDFVGQMNLPLVAVGEQFTAAFGVDPQLQVQRQMIDKARTVQGGNQSLRYDYRILISSYKPEKVKLQVWDRLPHADNESVGVNLLKSTPDLSKDALYLREQRPNNLLRWDVQVDPSMTGEKALAIAYEFKLELDRQMTISSFQSAGTTAVHEPARPHAPAGNPNPAPVSSAEEARIKAAMARLSPEDRALAEAQVWCAIDQESRLGSTGPILKEMVKGRPIFVCCKGCAGEVRAKPEEALDRLEKLMARMKGASGK
jgi:uncharacterized protein (TIGR02231 family)